MQTINSLAAIFQGERGYKMLQFLCKSIPKRKNYFIYQGFYVMKRKFTAIVCKVWSQFRRVFRTLQSIYD